MRTSTQSAKSVKKHNQSIVDSNVYYAEAIRLNREKNHGICYCENCGDSIRYPKGINVSHVIAKGSNIALYYDILNHFILCAWCEDIWTNRSRKSMNIFEESEEKRIKLTNKYYNE